MVLDLSVFEEETMDVKLAGGVVVHIKKPTQRLVIDMMGLRHINENLPEAQILAKVNEMAGKILSNNADGLTFDAAGVAGMPLRAKTELITAYSDFAVGLQSNPTAPSPRNPEKPERAERKRFFRVFGRLLNTRD